MKIGPIEIRRRRRFSQEARAPLGNLTFTCNVCGSLQSAEAGRFDRESVTCEECRSNVRFRAIVHLLTEHFLGHSAVLSHVSPMKHIKGLGLSDWPGYAELLAEKFDYVNTHFDRPPRLDITKPARSHCARYDFLISSDVFEHVLPPVQRAFDGAYQVLAPGGVLILTVPYVSGADCVEHFPGATGYKLNRGNGSVEIQHPSGDYMAENPLFHGGVGATLEMRAMSESGVLGALGAAGFTDIRIRGDGLLQFGVVHQSSVSLPIIARKPV